VGIKICHIITRLDKGGSAEVVLQLAGELHARGYDVHILSGLTVDPTPAVAEFTRKTGIAVRFIPHLQRDIRPAQDILALFYLINLLKREKPAIVHLHTSKAGFIGRIAARLAGVPCIVFTTHGHIFYGYFSKLKTWAFIGMERVAAHFCDVITTLTEKEKTDFLNLGIANPQKIVPVPNGMDLQPFFTAKRGQLRQEFGIPDETFLIGWIGRFEPVKGPVFFLSVCERLRDRSHGGVMAVMAGDGSLYDEMKCRRDGLGLDNFLLMPGYRSDIRNLVADMDIIVLTSLNEGFGMVILEAMAAGKPVIASDVGGVSELVADHVTGYLVRQGDTDAIVNHVISLMTNRELYNALSAQAGRTAGRYSLTAMIDKFEELYRAVLTVK
jgi:glycosyltransferase involved in cell wall biosynthesis